LVTAATVALAVAGFAAAANAYSDKVQRECSDDYLSSCSEHPVGSTGMRRCMEANGKHLTRRCINALVDAGEIPRKFKR
ncbi:hypothetical protein ABTL64_19485, partial [Acinetobacter baumannii]